jgi:hypothetical protein
MRSRTPSFYGQTNQNQNKNLSEMSNMKMSDQGIGTTMQDMDIYLFTSVKDRLIQLTNMPAHTIEAKQELARVNGLYTKLKDRVPEHMRRLPQPGQKTL